MPTDPLDPAAGPLDPGYLVQNPAPLPETGQDTQDKVRLQTNLIMERFLAVLPSNYVAQVTGPFYTLQFQAAAEQLAAFIVNAMEVYRDSDYRFTRSDFLWEIVGSLVLPDSGDTGLPVVGSDVALRTFLNRMVRLLLLGSTPASVEGGVESLTTAEVTILERFLEARVTGAAYGVEEQFTFDVLVEGFPPSPDGLTPTDVGVFNENVKKVLDALRPAHTLYDLRFLFRDAFGTLFSDSSSWEMSAYYYDDTRKFWEGARAISGSGGIVLTGRLLFSDPTRSFGSVTVGGRLRITSGDNEGYYRITEVLVFPVGTDATARAYTTAPTGLSGTATVSGGNTITDAAQDFGAAVEGEVLTFSAGGNAGVGVRLGTLLGLGGGAVGVATGPATQVRGEPSILRVQTRMVSTGGAQAYEADVDRLGVSEPHAVTAEDVSEQFIT